MCVPVPLEGRLIKHNFLKITSEVATVCGSEKSNLPIANEFDFSICDADRLFATDHTTLKPETWVKLGLESVKY